MRASPHRRPGTGGRLVACAAVAALLATAGLCLPAGVIQTTGRIDPAQSKACDAKLTRLLEFAAQESGAQRRETTFTEDEVNSYLALELSSQYHPSLKSLTVSFEETGLNAVAIIDFDRLGLTSKEFVTQLLATMFTGLHRLSIRGALVAEDGLGYLKLEQARFDRLSLPNVLVEEIVTAVGRKQDPPFDPMQQSPMPYRIRRVEVRRGFIVVHQ
ncbi:MAG: hypothetical protein FJW35_04585 [Acidobacteria bacterium]|nr:hypothetical protein [Acidobacteriota bacterium]